MRVMSGAQFAPVTQVVLEFLRTFANEDDIYKFGLPLRQKHLFQLIFFGFPLFDPQLKPRRRPEECFASAMVLNRRSHVREKPQFKQRTLVSGAPSQLVVPRQTCANTLHLSLDVSSDYRVIHADALANKPLSSQSEEAEHLLSDQC
jgi:hypothetical protein